MNMTFHRVPVEAASGHVFFEVRDRLRGTAYRVDGANRLALLALLGAGGRHAVRPLGRDAAVRKEASHARA